MDLKSLRENILNEASESPKLLSELSGLEDYISESYNNRAFVELLQNADDANATKFTILETDKLIYVANDGRDFTLSDIESLCRSAFSGKSRGASIGYRGIGFKSVVSFSKRIHLLSRNYQITFCKEKTRVELPNANKFPLVRVPHPLDLGNLSSSDSVIESLNGRGYTTIFIFEKSLDYSLDDSFSALDHNSLLFLKSVNELEVISRAEKYTVRSSITDRKSFRIHSIKVNSEEVHWKVFDSNSVQICFKQLDSMDVNLAHKALVYSFLPTDELTDFGFIVNGDFSTDPSRKHLIFDERTAVTISNLAELYFRILSDCLREFNPHNLSTLRALMPSTDLRLVQVKRSCFIKSFYLELREIGSNEFSRMLVCPSWLNQKDFFNLAHANGTPSVDYRFYDVNELPFFLKALGAKEGLFSDIVTQINDTDISVVGCAQILAHAIPKIISSEIKRELLSLKLFWSSGVRYAMNDLTNSSICLDSDFLEVLSEYGVSKTDLIKNFKNLGIDLSEYIDLSGVSPASSQILNDHQDDKGGAFESLISEKALTPIYQSSERFSKWRSAEELTLNLLNERGFSLQDVSKQNLGYDLSGKAPSGEQINIEVKSISFPGQKFKMTNNEVAVARNEKDSFYLALVRQEDTRVEICVIKNPTDTLVLNRQCVQWIWECSEYEYEPLIFNL